MKRTIAFIAAAILVAVASLYAFRSTCAATHVADGPDATTVEQLAARIEALEERSRVTGAGAGFLATGRQQASVVEVLEERFASGQSSIITANHCSNVDTMPAMSAAELDWYWGAVGFRYDVGLDASFNADGGTGSAYLTSVLPADLHGGQLCQMGGAVCAGTDGSGIDSPLLSFPPGNATAYGGTEHLVWSSATSQIQLQACCGTQPCRATGRISGQRWLPSGSADAGVADASDSGPVDSGSDAADAGSPPVMSALTAPIFQSASGGGPNVTLACSSGCAGQTVTVGGVSATVTASSPTSITYTPPALTASSTSYNIVVGGTATISSGGCTVACGAVYAWPAGMKELWSAGQGYNAGTSTWTDAISGVAAAPAGTSLDGGANVAPALTTNCANGLPCFSFTVPQQSFTTTAFTQAQPDSLFAYWTANNPAAQNQFVFDGVTGRQIIGTQNTTALAEVYGGSFLTASFTYGSFSWWEGFLNGGSSSINQNNGAATTGAGGASSLSGGAIIGGGNGYAAPIGVSTSNGKVAIACIFNGTPTSGERTIMAAIVAATY